MYYQIRVQRWVFWWLFVGVAPGVIAIGNILGRDLTHAQIRIILFLGVIHWVLGGLICYACDAVRVEQTSPPEPKHGLQRSTSDTEWYAAPDFLFPGHRKSVLPLRY